jgi:hypothetical protein
MKLEVQQGQVFKIAEMAYRTGVVDKVLPLTGEAMKIAKVKTGFGLTEMMEALNEAEDKSVERLDAMLKFSGPLLTLLGQEFLMVPLMHLASRLLDFAVVRRTAMWTMVKTMELTFKFQLKTNAKKLAALGVE